MGISRIPLLATLVLPLAAGAARAAEPDAPVVTEPALPTGVNPFDVHMVTEPFSDSDPGDTHGSTDWEIYDFATRTRVWSDLASNHLTHDHLGDGAFEGLLAGSDRLAFDAAYALRVRFRDSSGERSPWSAARRFRTAPATAVLPLETADVLASPAPRLLSDASTEIFLPVLPGPPRITLESPDGLPLFVVEARDGASHTLVDFATLPSHEPVRLTVTSSVGGPGVTIQPSRLALVTDDFEAVEVRLPPIALKDGASQVFWVSERGASYYGSPSDTEPDFSRLARGLPVPYSVPEGFRVEEAATGFVLPVSIAFVPFPGPSPGDPLYYVTELYGTIRVVKRSGEVGTFASGLLDFAPNGVFPGSGEEGLIGLAVDPDDPAILYATLVYREEADPGPNPLRNKLVRLRSDDGGLTAAGVEDLLRMPDDPTDYSHQVQSVTVGPDGKLYVTTGDGLLRASTARSNGSFLGKVLRLEKDGRAAADNPFYDAARPAAPVSYIYAKGMRNPFGAAWRALDGHLYTNENGEFIDRLARVERGRDYLWDGTAASLTNFAIHNWSPAVGPTGIAFAENGAFPPERTGRCYAAGSNGTYGKGPSARGKKIFEFVLAPDGSKLAEPEVFLDYVGAGRGTVAGIAFGPDGLYFSGLYRDDGDVPVEAGASVYRVVHTGVADFDASPRSGVAPLTAAFFDASTVPDPVSWTWTFGDGAASAERNPVHVYSATGSFNVSLAVTGRGGTVQAFRGGFIDVTPPPAPRIDSISPTIGSDAFPTRVAIRGGGFDLAGGFRVLVGGVPATNVEPIGAGLLRATVPPLPLGRKDVRVENDAGGGTLALGFTVRPASLACRTGNVNCGAGGNRASVLLVNGSAGDSDHVVRVAVGETIVMSIAPPPSRAGRTSANVVYLWNQAPRDETVVAWPFTLGLSALPTPLSGGAPAAAEIWNSIGKTSRLGAPTRPSPLAPATLLVLPNGLPVPQIVTLQGLVRDDAPLVPSKQHSATNAIVIEVTP